MKVLHVIPSISYKQGGPTEAVINFVRYLRHFGIEAEIVTTNDDLTGVLDVPLKQRCEYAGVPVWFFPRTARLKAYIPSLSLFKWLVQHIKDYDIIHNHYLFSAAPTAASLVASYNNIPYVSSTIGQLTPWALAQSAIKKKIYGSLIERPILNRAKAIHCTTQEEAEDVAKFGVFSPKLVIPLGINPILQNMQARKFIRARYNLDENCFIILFLSRLHKKKRPDFLIEVFASLAKRCQKRQIKLIIAGSGESSYYEYLKEKAKLLGVSDNIIFPSFVVGEDKDILLQGSDAFALPSYSENFGIAVIEALGSGLPVAITPEVQISSAISSANAGLVIPHDIKLWVAEFLALIESNELRRELSENAKKLVEEKYMWSSVVKSLALGYEEIISGDLSLK